MIPAGSSVRTAGLLYLLLAVTGGFSMLYVPSLIVEGDAAATAANLVANEPLFRLGIASGLTCQVVFLFLVLALYNLFKAVNGTQATVMVALVMVAIPVAFLNLLNQLAALHILRGADYLGVFAADQLNALVMLFLDLHGQGLLILEVFWGLWLLPLGMLVIKSRFIPRFIGVLVIMAGVGYLFDVLTRLLFPTYAAMVSPIAAVAKVGEMAIIVWLLIMGLKKQPAPLAGLGT
jgi:nitrate reductase NapE component